MDANFLFFIVLQLCRLKWRERIKYRFSHFNVLFYYFSLKKIFKCARTRHKQKTCKLCDIVLILLCRTVDIHSEDVVLWGEFVDHRSRSDQGQGNPKLPPSQSPTARDGEPPLKSLSRCKQESSSYLINLNYNFDFILRYELLSQQ